MKFTAKTFTLLAIFCLIVIAVDAQTTGSGFGKIPSVPTSTSPTTSVLTSKIPTASVPISTNLPPTVVNCHQMCPFASSSSSPIPSPPKVSNPFLIGLGTGIGVLAAETAEKKADKC
ncbi:hypothetical protein Glove_421g76 [Diversispora epigaea]|uniref:Uncharacterized protein n=1 Tax=Diversispora epigaea TaxID=1348612 RepID=A0A397GVX7_9GLOM|nr:hypothetical protein Glove_421g76 [Diversispora epigaea]